jgi:hypothetical protein
VVGELADSMRNFRHLTIAKNGSFVFFGRVGVMVNAGVSLFTQPNEKVSSCVHMNRGYVFCVVPSHQWTVLGAGSSFAGAGAATATASAGAGGAASSLL